MRALGWALLASGIVLLVFGIQAAHSFNSNVSRAFTGEPTNHAIWLIIGGVVAAVAGAASLSRR